MDTKLVVTKLQRALSTHKKPNHLHTDMDSQLTSFGFENFHSLLKREMIYQFRFPSIAHLILDVSKYIQWFNDERISLANRNMKVA